MIENEAGTQSQEGLIDTAQYARVELMGHRQRVGQIQEVTQYGTTMLRVDFYDPETEMLATEFYNGASIYCLSPLTKEVVEAYEERQQSYRKPSLRHLPAPDDDRDHEDRDPFRDDDRDHDLLDDDL